jgi:hypothetical protein
VRGLPGFEAALAGDGCPGGCRLDLYLRRALDMAGGPQMWVAIIPDPSLAGMAFCVPRPQKIVEPYLPAGVVIMWPLRLDPDSGHEYLLPPPVIAHTVN